MSKHSKSFFCERYVAFNLSFFANFIFIYQNMHFLIDDIVKETGNTEIIVRQLDLASLKSVRKFANDILESERRLDILINNAGCFVTDKRLTEDDLEYQMQSNHFGHFLLTNLLLGMPFLYFHYNKENAQLMFLNRFAYSHRFFSYCNCQCFGSSVCQRVGCIKPQVHKRENWRKVL